MLNQQMFYKTVQTFSLGFVISNQITATENVNETLEKRKRWKLESHHIVSRAPGKLSCQNLKYGTFYCSNVKTFTPAFRLCIHIIDSSAKPSQTKRSIPDAQQKPLVARLE